MSRAPSASETYRERPFLRGERVVGQVPSVKARLARTGVEDLDPIWEVALFIRQGGRILRHEFGNDRRAPCGDTGEE
ncbi:MAG: hypothetical protein R3F11_17090 [Verrucomicrobiales bacterium]